MVQEGWGRRNLRRAVGRDTANVTYEIQAPVTGVLSDILVSDGVSVEVGAPASDYQAVLTATASSAFRASLKELPF